CSPATAGSFTAVGYHYGRVLHEMLGVPVGLIDNAWGGSACRCMPPPACWSLTAAPRLKRVPNKV
ncbi:MAG: hypothetical protein ABL932_21795, partial [Terricaulis sp.]